MTIALFTTQLKAQTLEFWGVTSTGGEYNAGTIYSTDTNGNNHTVRYSFKRVFGDKPEDGLLLASNGKLYGMTNYGGTSLGGINQHAAGEIYEYDPATAKYTPKVDFYTSKAGLLPYGSLIQATNGKLYGLTSRGGYPGNGTLFEYDLAKDTIVSKAEFSRTLGGEPKGTLLQANNGKLYGVTEKYGTNSDGSLFEYDLVNDTLVILHHFDDTASGRYASGTLTQIRNGKLYGFTALGGRYDDGVLFEYDLAKDTFIKKVDFYEKTVGGNPVGAFLLENDTVLLGACSKGGSQSSGTLYKYYPTIDSFVVMHEFQGKLQGQAPNGGLMRLGNGKLYGGTLWGGANGDGILYEYDPVKDTLINLMDFEDGMTGDDYSGRMVQVGGDKLFGICSRGGLFNKGTLYEYHLGDSLLEKKLDFGGYPHGHSPQGRLTPDTNGYLCGTTIMGGPNNNGTIYRFDPVHNTVEVKVHLDYKTTGNSTYESPILASNGKFYGATAYGGKYTYGTLYEYDPEKDTFSVKVDFRFTTNGRNPFGPLLQTSTGKIYGTTYNGGSNKLGVLFEYDIAKNTLTKKVDFDKSVLGNKPRGGLFEAVNGKIYGTTSSGGASGGGTLFEYDTATNKAIAKVPFNGSGRGSIPHSGIIADSNGVFYGVTNNGGTRNFGVLYEYHPKNDSFVKKVDFVDTITGSYPRSKLIQGANGKLYGVTLRGGQHKYGVLFEYEPRTDSFVRKFDFDTRVGFPNGGLIETDLCYPTFDTVDTLVCVSYTSPSMKYTWSQTGSYLDTLVNYDGCDSIITINVFIKRNEVTLDTSACDSMRSFSGKYLWDSTGTFVDTLTNVFGCDSVLTVNLTVHRKSFDTLTISSCDSLVSPSGGQVWKLSGSYNDTLVSIYGCDSILTVHLTIKPSSFTIVDSAVCDSMQSFSGAATWTASGTYTDTLTNAIGCDSIVQVNLTVLKSHVTIDSSVCDYMNSPGGNALWDTSGTYFDTIPNAAGCDSVIQVNLTVLNSRVTLDSAVCDSMPSFSGSGVWRTSGTYIDTIPNQKGCDSIIKVNLKVLANKSTLNLNVCDSLPSFSGNTVWRTSGTYVDTIPNAAGCDSVITVNLKVLNTQSTIDTVVCSGMQSLSGGATWSMSGTYIDVIPNKAGCDSTVTVHLTVLNTQSTFDSTVCASMLSPSGNYLWDSSATYLDTVQNHKGCDSIITVNLLVLNSRSAYDTTVCDSLVSVSGKYVWKTSGTYFDTIPNVLFCDSIMKIDLTVNNSTVTLIDTIIRSPITLSDGTMVSKTGIYPDTLIGFQNCDSILIYDVTDASSVSYVSSSSMVMVYPNPSKGLVTVETKTPKLTMRVYDGLGRKLMTLPIDEPTKTSLRLDTGVYFLEFQSPEARSREKIVILE